MILSLEKNRLKNRQFILITNNCWGYEIYQTLGRRYNTPFVGLFLFPECYLGFLQGFERFINSQLEFTNSSKYFDINGKKRYPIGLLNKVIEIHFLHYTSEQEAFEKWNRRLERLKRDLKSNIPVFLKFDDRDGCKKEHLERFHELPFENKLSIGLEALDNKNHICVPQLKDPEAESVIDGYKLYKKRYYYFDINDWFLKGIVHRTPLSKILSVFT